MTPCTLKLFDAFSMAYEATGSCAPNHLVGDGAHLVGEAIFVTAVLLRGYGDSSCGLLEVLCECDAFGVCELREERVLGDVRACRDKT